jgi:predicted Zn-dependent protease
MSGGFRMSQLRQVAAAFCVGAALLGAGTLHAVQQGRVVGKITDGKGVPLADVKITITTASITTFKLEVKTDKDGKWGTLLNDATLTYTYKFEKQGYLTHQQNKKVPIGSTEELNVQLLTQDQAVEKGVVKEVIDPYLLAYNGAVEKFQAGELDAALELAHKAIELGPGKVSALDMATKVSFAKKDWDHTIEFGEKALALEPDNPALFGPLYEANKQKGNKEKAAEYEKKFVAANPDKPEILYNQAVALYNKGDFKGAEPILRKILEGKPDYANAHFLLGMSCVNLNKIPDMKTHLNEYLRLEPTRKEAGTAKEMLEAFK